MVIYYLFPNIILSDGKVIMKKKEPKYILPRNVHTSGNRFSEKIKTKHLGMIMYTLATNKQKRKKGFLGLVLCLIRYHKAETS